MWSSATIVVLASYGFMKNFSPDYQYFSDYLTGPKQFTKDEVTQEIYPVVVYCNIGLTLIALLVTDLLQYKPVIIIGAVTLIFSKTTLYYGTSILHMQVAEMFYSVSKASNLGYNTYVYTQIDKEHYQFATAVIQISPKIGKFLSSLTAEILLSNQLASLENLLQINMVALILALLLTFCLATPNYSFDHIEKDLEVCQHTKKEFAAKSSNTSFENSTCVNFKEHVKQLWNEFISTHTNPYLMKWSLWMVISMGVIELVLNYYSQALWSEVSGSKQNIYNGLADASYMAFSTAGCYIAGRVKIDWALNRDFALGLISLLKGTSILASCYSLSLPWCYTYYVIYAVSSDVSLIYYRAEVAKHVKNFGLYFGIDQFLAICLQSALTFLLTSRHGLALSIRHQFSVAAWCFIVLGVAFGLKDISKLFTTTGKLVIKEKPATSGNSVKTDVQY